jgi:hypothetical protein
VMIQLQYMPILLTELVYDALHKGENVLKWDMAGFRTRDLDRCSTNWATRPGRIEDWKLWTIYILTLYL